MDTETPAGEQREVLSSLVGQNAELKKQIDTLFDDLLQVFWEKYPPLQIVDSIEYFDYEFIDWMNQKKSSGGNA